MKAVGLYKYLPIDHEDSLIDINIKKPSARGRDLLVEIKAISVNPVDTKVRSPKNVEETDPKILGWDATGVVVEVGEECTLFQPGDEVFYSGSLNRPGTYSEYHLVDERIVGKKPQTLNFAEAAAMPLTSITAWQATEIAGLDSSFSTTFLDSFIQGYEKSYPLSPDTIKQIPLFVRWREFFLYALFKKKWPLHALQDWQSFTLEKLRNRILTGETYIPIV